MLQEVKSQKLKVKSSEEGQVLIIAILIVIVSLTIGLSIASRGIINLRTSTEEADSQKALAAAEAGIEKVLQNTTIGTDNFDFNVSTGYETVVDTQDGDRFLLNGGSLITQGEGADVWFAAHLANGSIDYSTVLSPPRFHIFWGAPGEENCDSSNLSRWPAALEVIVVSGTSATNITTTRHTFDQCDGSNPGENRDNNFASAQNVGGGGNNLGIPGGPTFMIRTPGSGQDLVNVGDIIFMRIIPIYKSAVIGVRACNSAGTAQCTDLPSQGFEISSTGKTGTTSRKLKVFKGHEQAFLPYISYGLFVPEN